MLNVRIGAFETNSSNYHSFVIHIGDDVNIDVDCEYEQDDVWLNESDLDEILYNLPIERLENALKNRKEYAEREEKENKLNQLWSDYTNVCKDCGPGNGCDDCRYCDKAEQKHKIYLEIQKLQKELK